MFIYKVQYRYAVAYPRQLQMLGVISKRRHSRLKKFFTFDFEWLLSLCRQCLARWLAETCRYETFPKNDILESVLPYCNQRNKAWSYNFSSKENEILFQNGDSNTSHLITSIQMVICFDVQKRVVASHIGLIFKC